MMLKAEFALLDFHLEFAEDFSLPAFGLLRLRREFQRLMTGGIDQLEGHPYALIRPPIPVDPEQRRRVQQPAPGFVIQTVCDEEARYTAGEELVLRVCFVGQATQQIVPLAQLLDSLGQVGLLARRGRFQLERIDNAHPFAAEKTLWQKGELVFAPHLAELSQCLEDPPPQRVRLEFQSPARLLTQRRPLFQPDFRGMFPFMLRRVTAMLATWTDSGGREFDIPALLAAAAGLSEEENLLQWRDWRPLQTRDEIGGVCGAVALCGPELAELWPIMKLSELFGLGKGAAYGAGRFRLI